MYGIDAPVFLQALLFFLPAGISNMTPVFASKMPIIKNWNAPMDLGYSWRGKRILGPHKTWRGLISGVVAGTLAGYLLHGIFFPDASLNTVLLASASMSFGALFGDALESFFKRQREIPSGRSWFPFDQTDYIIGGLVFAALFVPLTVALVIWVFICYFGLHLLSSYIGYKLGLKDQPI